MDHLSLLTVTGAIGATAILAYRWPYLHKKKIAYISLLQYALLIIIPSVFYSFVFLFILDITKRPKSLNIFLNDHIIIVLLLLSLLYTYAGLAIHSICKTLSACFSKKDQKSFVYKVNKYFHLKFSHNLIYSGAVTGASFLSILELNHLPIIAKKSNLILLIINGIIIGIVFVINIFLYQYNKSPIKEHDEKQVWSDLKYFFYTYFIAFLVYLYALKPHFKTLYYYPISFSIFTAAIIIMLLLIFLYTRRLYRKNKYRIKKTRARSWLNFLFLF